LILKRGSLDQIFAYQLGVAYASVIVKDGEILNLLRWAKFDGLFIEAE